MAAQGERVCHSPAHFRQTPIASCSPVCKHFGLDFKVTNKDVDPRDEQPRGARHRESARSRACSSWFR